MLSLAGWVAAFFLAQWLATDAVAWIPFVQNAAPSVQYAAGYAVVFVGSLFVSALLSWLIKKVIESVGLRPVDRMLGGLFGLLRAALRPGDHPARYGGEELSVIMPATDSAGVEFVCTSVTSDNIDAFTERVQY